MLILISVEPIKIRSPVLSSDILFHIRWQIRLSAGLDPDQCPPLCGL
jgi:hypothetical protein